MRCRALFLALLLLPACQRTDRAASAAEAGATIKPEAIAPGDSASIAPARDSTPPADSAAGPR